MTPNATATPFSSPLSRVTARTVRTSTLAIAPTKTRTERRGRSVSLLLRLPRPARVHIALAGPAPSCATALTVTARAHKGINRLRLTSAKVRRLKPGRYLVTVPAPGRDKPLVAAVAITAGHRIRPVHRAAALAKQCTEASPGTTSSAGVAAGNSNNPTPNPKKPAPAAAHHHHGSSVWPSGLPSVGTVTHRAAQTGGSSVHYALNHLVLLAMFSLLAVGGWAIVFPLARLIDSNRHR